MKTRLPQSGPLTYEQIAEEVGRGYTDPDHPMYRWRATERFDEWCDALYHRIPGNRVKVVIGTTVQASRDDRAEDLTLTQRLGHRTFLES
jgi:hypothetical protein